MSVYYKCFKTICNKLMLNPFCGFYISLSTLTNCGK